MRYRRITPEIAEQITTLYNSGESVQDIFRITGFYPNCIKRIIDPKFREQNNQYMATYQARYTKSAYLISQALLRLS